MSKYIAKPLWRRCLSAITIFVMVFGMFQFSPPQAVLAATQTLGGDAVDGNLRVEVYDEGSIGLFRYDAANTQWETLVYNGQDAGTAENPNKNSRLQYTGNGYYFGWPDGSASNPTDSQATAVSNTKVGDTVVSVFTAGSTRVTQTVSYSNGDDFIRYDWAIQNTGGSALSGLRFFNGMDTCLGMTDYYCEPTSDTGAGLWLPAARAVGARHVSGSTETRFYLQGVTAPENYDSLAYFDMWDHMQGGALTDGLNTATDTDNGYALEWRQASLAAGDVWTITAYERFSIAAFDSVFVVAPPLTEIEQGASGDLVYTLTNDDTADVSVALSVSKDQPTWTATLQGATTLTVPASSSITVTVQVDVPASAAIGATGAITLTADGPAAGVSADAGNVLVTEVPVVNYTLTTHTVGAGSVTKDPDQATYLAGTVVTLTATAVATTTFSGWMGDCAGSGDCVLTMDDDKEVWAVFTAASEWAPIVEPFQCSASGDWLLFDNAEFTGDGDPDPDCEGWLRLTAAVNDQSGVAIYDVPIPNGDGFVATFQYATYGATVGSADGFSFFLIDGATAAPTAGANGGSLGYSFYSSNPGVTNGYVGIGVDEYGNFSTPSFGTGGPGFQPQSVAIRGSGSLLSGFNYLTGVSVAPYTIDGVDRANARWVRMFVVNNRITVQMDFGAGWQTLINSYNLTTAPGQSELPDTFKIGFGAATGGQNNYHEIRNLTVAKAARLDVAEIANRTAAVPGDSAVFTATITNDDQNDVLNAVVTAPVPARLSNATWTCTASADAVCGAPDGTGAISHTVVMLKNSTLTYTIHAVVTGAPGPLTHTTSIEPPPAYINLGDGRYSVGITIPPALQVTDATGFVGDTDPVVVAPTLVITRGTADTLAAARVRIADNFDSGDDELGIEGESGSSGSIGAIAWNYDGTTGVMTLNGTDTITNYQAALRTVTFYSAMDPTEDVTRTVEFGLGASLAFAGTGHFYERVPGAINRNTALTEAAARSYFGLQGYLATVTSDAERRFVGDKVADATLWLGGQGQAIGGEGYRWVTGPEGLENGGAGRLFWVPACGTGTQGICANTGEYNYWQAVEPNANSLQYVWMGYQAAEYWDDTVATNISTVNGGYLVEYGGMPNDPVLQITGATLVTIVSSIADSDGDGISNITELDAGTDPFDETDNDTVAEKVQTLVDASDDPADGAPIPTDLINTGLTDVITDSMAAYEVGFTDPTALGLPPFSAPPTLAELQAVIDAINQTSDSDGDGISDATELDAGTDPFDGTDNATVEEKVQTLVDASDNPADGAPTLQDLANTGLTNVITGNLGAYEVGFTDPTALGLPPFSAPPTQAELQAVIDAVNQASDSDNDGISDATELDAGTDPFDGTDNDTVEEKVQTLVDASDDPADGAPTPTDLINTGLTGVITASMAAYEVGFTDPTALGLPAFSAPPTLAELQAVIDAVNAQDSDGDGISDATELDAGTNPNDGTDNDTIAEKVQTLVDASDNPADGAPTMQDLINTGLTDVITSNLSAYEVGFTDPTALGLPPFSAPPTQAELQAVIDAVNRTHDSDGDGVPDAIEVKYGTDPTDGDDPWGDDPNETTDPTADDDGDGVPNAWERILGTDPNDPDSDSTRTTPDENNNGTGDADEDFDGDGVPNGIEIAYGTDPLDPNDPASNPTADDDGDGVTNAWEAILGTDPNDPDSDSSLTTPDANYNGTGDADEDFDGDGVPNGIEIAHGTDPLDPNDPAANPTADDDGDGVTNAWEAILGTDPNDPDSDSSHTTPNENDNGTGDADEDFDGDGISNGDEIAQGSDPLNPNDPIQYTLTIATTGDGSGVVTPTIGAHPYVSGTVVQLEATPNTGSLFSGWSGDADCTDASVTMDGNKMCTATFALIPIVSNTLSIATTGDGGGVVTPTIGAHPYVSGTVVQLEATPNTGSIFSGWSGDADCADASVTMDGNKMCTATFLLQGINHSPQAMNDEQPVPEGIGTTLAVLANDSDPDGDVLTITQVSAPAHGVATTDGATIIYTPTTEFLGTDTFIYTISDGELVDSAQVTVTVSPVADLSVEQTREAIMGGLKFTIVARNLGPRPANGAVISDVFPSVLTNINWTCESAGGAACPNASGSGDIQDTLSTFPSGGVVTYTVTTLIGEGGIAFNTVNITPPAGVMDIVMSNNTASVPTIYLVELSVIFRDYTP